MPTREVYGKLLRNNVRPTIWVGTATAAAPQDHRTQVLFVFTLEKINKINYTYKKKRLI
jgi:hypothetical protein